jgi:uncharacterized protein
MKNSYTLITGASSGIGLALAKEFALNKHNLILVARREQKLQTIARELKSAGIEVEVIVADLASNGGAEALFDTVQKKGLNVEMLVNNAGRGNSGEFAEQDADHMRGTLELNITALTMLSRLFMDQMKANGYGRILNMASVAGFMPGPGLAVYHATKAYVLSLSEALNVELKDSGVTVTASCPGPTESEFHDQAGTRNLKAFTLFSLMTATQVAQEAYAAMMEGKPFVVHGYLNQLMSVSPKIIPRSWVPKMVKSFLSK